VNAAWAIEQAERKIEMAGPTASFGKIDKPNELVSAASALAVPPNG
jgi:hypothetical protein